MTMSLSSTIYRRAALDAHGNHQEFQESLAERYAANSIVVDINLSRSLLRRSTFFRGHQLLPDCFREQYLQHRLIWNVLRVCQHLNGFKKRFREPDRNRSA